jgi:hypothetical protein
MQFGNFRDEMSALPKPRAGLQRPDRRSFLWSVAALGLTTQVGISEIRRGTVYRFVTPLCEVRMSVEYFATSSINGFRFRDVLTNQSFCLSAGGEKDRNCLERFVGSMAIVHYQFRAHHHYSGKLFGLRERVLMIDHDRRIPPRAPFERELAAEQTVVSDIQAFGYNAVDSEQTSVDADHPAVWYLVRQDLYLNDQNTAFLVVHWKHTLDCISLLDVIPGDGTKLISD